MDYAIVPSSELGAANTWSARHHLAMRQPTPEEEPLVTLVYLINELAERFADDGLMRQGVAPLIVGTLTLLNAEWGRRLDMGSIDHQLRVAAERIGFDLDTETFAN